MKQSPHVCPWWLAYTFDNPLRKLIHKPERMFAAYVRPGMRVADVGCGMGFFSLGMGRMVEPGGKVLAVDMQPRMLARTAARARRAGLAGVIETHLCDSTSLNIDHPMDFVLAFWMVHETPNQLAFLDQVAAVLKPSGALLVAEPKNHVSARQFSETLSLAEVAGFHLAEQPPVAFSRAALLKVD